MKPSQPCSRPQGPFRRGVPAACRAVFAMAAFTLLSACEQNSFVPPPPPKVEVALPVQRPITRYFEATGNAAPIKTVDLVARVQGFLQSINYKDGACEERHHALHDRAGALQIKAPAGASRRGRRAGDA